MAGAAVAKQVDGLEKEKAGHRGEQRIWSHPKKGVAAFMSQRVEHRGGGVSNQLKKTGGGGGLALDILKDESEKENVGWRGGTLGQPRKGVGGLGLRGGQDVRKVKSGVLADNPTLGNRGALGALELLKERMKELQLAASLSRLPSRTTGASSSGSSSSAGLDETPSREEDSIKFRSNLLPPSPLSAERESSSVQNKSYMSSRSTRRISTPGFDGTPVREDDSAKFRTSLPPASPFSAERDNSSVQNKPFMPSRITKRLKHVARPLSGPALRVLRVRTDEDNSGSVSKDDVVESRSCRISPTAGSPAIVSNCSLSSEDVEKYERQLGYDYLWTDRRKRKAEQDPSNRDTTQMEDVGGSGVKSVQEKLIEGAARTQWQISGGLEGKELPQRASPRGGVASVEKSGEPHRLYFRSTKALGAVREVESEPPKNLRVRFVPSDSPHTSSWPTKIRAGGVQSATRQSSRVYLEKQSEVGASEALKDSGQRSMVKPLQAREAASVELASNELARVALKIPISTSRSHEQYSPLVESRKDSDERNRRKGLQTRGSPNVKELKDLTMDMSHDASPSQENSENRLTTAVNDLSSSLGALSVGEKDMLKKPESKPPLHDSMNTSPIPSVVPTNQAATTKCQEHSGAPITSSHSIVTSENVFNDNARDGRSALERPEPERPQKDVSVEKQVRSPPFPSENSGARHPNVSLVGTNPNEHKLGADQKAVPVERAENNSCVDSGVRTSRDTLKDTNKDLTPATSQKFSENSHFVWVRGKRYQKLGKIGKGGSSEVYKVIDSECNIYALKKINLKGRDHCAARGFYQEIEYLERLKGKRNIVQLIGYEVTNRTVIMEHYEAEKISEDACIYMVLEFGEIDLASILSKKRKEMMESNEIIDDNWLRFYWKHMLLAVKTIHDERIVHADLKPANFLLVRGELKLIDFGIAKAIQNDTTHIVRDSQVGTLNYMSPEAFMMNSKDEHGQTIKCGRSSDIWSLGCILYQMVYGHTPFSHVQSFYAKIQAITSRNYKIEFPTIPDVWLLDVMKKCLTWDRNSRPHITDLLQHPFLRPELAMQDKFVAE